ncbi:MAG TPA: dTDP-4-dehydrorhamnose 3,5-epimerase family protein [Terrimesophilobacter sp.]|nr:dTDP-4-dehydrorhamnose 3,5-epimerase family protein [Terrimesophilobacter sp.]
MQIRELDIPDAFEITPVQHEDDRGVFLEWYRFDDLEEAVGHPFTLRQANISVSRKGVVRGIHFAEIPLGQAKYVTVTSGAVLDFVIDIRVGSPTFGMWDSVLLDTRDRRAVYVAEGLGHLALSLTDDATFTYLVSDIYQPQREHGINPLDPEVGLVFPNDAPELVLSSKDTDAPGLLEAQELGILPSWDQAKAFYRSLSMKGS